MDLIYKQYRSFFYDLDGSGELYNYVLSYEKDEYVFWYDRIKILSENVYIMDKTQLLIKFANQWIKSLNVDIVSRHPNFYKFYYVPPFVYSKINTNKLNWKEISEKFYFTIHHLMHSKCDRVLDIPHSVANKNFILFPKSKKIMWYFCNKILKYSLFTKHQFPDDFLKKYRKNFFITQMIYDQKISDTIFEDIKHDLDSEIDYENLYRNNDRIQKKILLSKIICDISFECFYKNIEFFNILYKESIYSGDRVFSKSELEKIKDYLCVTEKFLSVQRFITPDLLIYLFEKNKDNVSMTSFVFLLNNHLGSNMFVLMDKKVLSYLYPIFKKEEESHYLYDDGRKYIEDHKNLLPFIQNKILDKLYKPGGYGYKKALENYTATSFI